MDSLLILEKIPVIGEQAADIYRVYTTVWGYVATKYPVILRPVITFLVAVFMTPSKLGLYILYPVYFYVLVSSYFKLYANATKYAEQKDMLFSFTTPIVFVISVVFILPGYSQAKYYMFLMPFIIHSLLSIYSIKKIYYFLTISNILVIVFLAIKSLQI
jgi:hypothetical protein